MASGCSSPAADLLGDPPHGVDNFRPASVVDRQTEADSRVAARHLHRPIDLVGNIGRQPFAAANHGEPHVVLHQRGALGGQVEPQQLQKRPEFIRRSLPVLRRQTVQSQLFDSQSAALGRDRPHDLRAAAMAFDPELRMPLGPPPVAVHNDRDVPRPPLARHVTDRRFDRHHVAEHVRYPTRCIGPPTPAALLLLSAHPTS